MAGYQEERNDLMEQLSNTREPQARRVIREKMQRLEKPERGMVRSAYDEVADAGRAWGDFTAIPFTKLMEYTGPSIANAIPNPIKAALGSGAQSVGEVYSFLGDKYPESVEFLEDTLAVAEFAPAFAMFKKAPNVVNALSDQFKTNNENWYSGNPFKKAKGVVDNLTGAVPAVVNQAYSPNEKAIRREVGTGSRRIDEVLNPEGSQRIPQGSIRESAYIAHQQNSAGDTLVENLPTYTASMHSLRDLSTERPALLQDLKFMYPDTPDDIVEDLMDRSLKALEQPSGKVEKLADTMTNPGGVKSTSVAVRDPRARGAELGKEATGTHLRNVTALNRYADPKKRAAFGEAIGVPVEQWGMNENLQFLKVSSIFDPSRWDSMAARLPAALTYEGSGVRRKMRSASAVYNDYEKAKRAAKPTVKQQAILDAVDTLVQDKDNDIFWFIRQDGDNRIKFNVQRTSAEQELGGMMVAGTHDLSTDNIYTMMLDGHDIFGANPVGGKGLHTFTPVMVRNAKEAAPKLETGDAVPEIKAKEQAAVTALEKRTGLKKEKGESIIAYEKRVLEHVKNNATPTSSEFNQARSNTALTGMLGYGSGEEDTGWLAQVMKGLNNEQ